MAQFFTLCAEIEQTIGAIYRVLGESDLGDAELRSLWQNMAREEEDHAQQIRLAGRLPQDQSVSGTRIPLAEAQRLRQRAGELLNQVKSATIDLATALRLSLQIEREFLVVHAHCAAEFTDPKMAMMFKALAWDDERHARAILDYCLKAGIPVGGEKE